MSSEAKPTGDYRPDEAALREMVAEVDTGARQPARAGVRAGRRALRPDLAGARVIGDQWPTVQG